MNDDQKTNEANAVGNRRLATGPAAPPPSGAASGSEYVPWGPQWEKAVMRLPKGYLVKLLRSAAMKNARYAGALHKIACWDEGETVTGSFDEPASADMARDALSENL